MDNVFTEGTQDQSGTFPSGGALVWDVHVIHSKCNMKISQRFLNWDSREGGFTAMT